MEETSTSRTRGISRRTLVKGAAWSVPVVAAAVAVPAQAASLPGVDVGVSATCSGNYDLGILRTLLGNNSVLVALAQGVLSGLGFQPNATRSFTITAVQGTIPTGTQFELTYPPALIDVTALTPLLQAQALGLVSANNGTAIIQTTAPIPQGSAKTVDLFTSIVDVSLAGAATLTLLDTDDPNPAPGAANSATVSSAVGATVDLGTVVPGATLKVQICGGTP